MMGWRRIWSASSRVVVVALFSALLGCTSYRPALLPSDSIPAEARGRVHVVGVGSQIRAKLKSGRTVEGEVVSLAESSLSVEQSGNYGYGRVDIGLAPVS